MPIVTALYTERVWHDPIRIERNDEKKEGVETKENHRGGIFWDAGATKLCLPEKLHVSPTHDYQKSRDSHNHVHHHLLEITHR